MCQADHAVFVITTFVVLPSPTPKQRSFHLGDGDAIWRDQSSALLLEILSLKCTCSRFVLKCLGWGFGLLFEVHQYSVVTLARFPAVVGSARPAALRHRGSVRGGTGAAPCGTTELFPQPSY